MEYGHMAKRKTRTKLVYGADAHYWPEQVKRLCVAFALIDMVSERRQSAREKLEEAVKAWHAPGCQELFGKDIVVPTRDVAASLSAWKKGGSHEATLDWVTAVEAARQEDEDVKKLWHLLNEFIGSGFNKSRKTRVVPEQAPWLQVAAFLWTMGEYSESHFGEDDRLELKLGNTVIDSRTVFEGVGSERAHRRRTRVFKHFGLRLTHDKKINNMARLWYLSRVHYSGPMECAAKLQLQGERWTEENLSKEMALADEVTGYPRRKPRKTERS